MAGNYSGPGHKIVSGEVPVVGLKVFTNEYKEGVIVEVATDEGCGWYCNAWHTVEYPAADGKPARKITMNCDRLTTRKP